MGVCGEPDVRPLLDGAGARIRSVSKEMDVGMKQKGKMLSTRRRRKQPCKSIAAPSDDMFAHIVKQYGYLPGKSGIRTRDRMYPKHESYQLDQFPKSNR